MTEEIRRCHRIINGVRKWKEGMFFKLPFIGKGHFDQHDLDRLEKILEGEK